MDFKFDLQMFGAVDISGQPITLSAAVGADTTTSELYIGVDGEIYADMDTLGAATTLASTVTLSSSVTIANGSDSVNAKATAVKVSAVSTGNTITLPTTCQVTDANGVQAFTVAGATLQGKAFTVADSVVTSFTDLTVKTAAIAFNGSGTVVLDEAGTPVTATASSFDGELISTGGVVSVFKSGSLTVPAGSAAFTLLTANLAGVGGTFTALTSNDNPYIEAKLTSNSVAVALTGAAVPFHVIGTNYADDITTSKTNADTIVSGAGNDTITVASAKAVSVDAGDGNDTIKDSAITNEATILGGAGNDEITFGKASTSVLFDGGDGNDKITLTNVTKSTVLGGAGSDTLSTDNATNVLTGGDGADYFVAGKDKDANTTDYSYAEDFIATDATSLADAAAVVKTALAANKFTSDGNTGIIKDDGAKLGDVTIQGSNGAFAVKMVATNKDKLGVGWVGTSGTSINASEDKDAVILIGTTNSEGDTLVGGTKADTIFAGVNDSVYGGAGSDSISIANGAYGVFVGLSTASGADAVDGFIAGWDTDTADSIYMIDGSADSLKATYDGTNASLKSGSATLTFTNTKGAAATDKTTDDAKILINGKKVDVIKKGSLVAVGDDSTFADYYFGTEASGIDMTSYTGDVEVNLSNEMFRNIATVKAGSGNMSVLGGKSAEYLVGGAGATSLYGGAGTDTLVSGKGVTTFFADANSGKDVVTGFVVGSGDDADVLNVSSIKSVSRSDDKNFVLNVDDKNSLKVTQASGDINSNIQWVSGDAKGVAKIGKAATANKFSYDVATTNYIGSTKIDTVSIASGTTDSFNVWLDKTGGTFSSIEVYDFSQTSGDVLAAGKADTAETIVAGKGTSSLWGGAGNTKDVLQNKNSSATTEFFYGLGEGNDVIEGKSDDSVNLYNISVSDITKATINSNNVVFTTSANNTVTVSGSVGTFKLADGSSWKADYSKKTWVEGN